MKWFQNYFKRRYRNKNKLPINCSTAFSKYLDHVHDWAGILGLVNNKKGLITQIIYTWYGCLYIARFLKICISDVFLAGWGLCANGRYWCKTYRLWNTTAFNDYFYYFSPNLSVSTEFVKMLTSSKYIWVNILKGRHGQSTINCQWSVIQ